MKKIVNLDPSKLTALRQIDERLVSYNIEMTEVTGAPSGKLTRKHRWMALRNSLQFRIGVTWAIFSNGTIPLIPPIPG